eukprot:2584477-Amphidinium_carterae.1
MDQECAVRVQVIEMGKPVSEAKAYVPKEMLVWSACMCAALCTRKSTKHHMYGSKLMRRQIHERQIMKTLQIQ